MITVLENSLTKKKHTLNLVDNRGRVVGFNPYPDGKPLKYEFRNSEGILVSNEKYRPIEQYLVGAPFHFGSDISFVPSEIDDSLTAMNVDLITDNHGLINELHIEGQGGEYYVEDIGLSKEDLNALFSQEKIQYWKEHASWRPLYPYELKVEKTWEDMAQTEKLEYLLSKVSKLEEKVNLLGNLK